MAKENKGRPHAGANAANQRQTEVPPQSAITNPAIPRPCTQSEPCYTQNAPPENLLPEWRQPEWVSVYVAIIYSIITGLMWWTIKRQANIMEGQANDARESGQKSLDFLNLQLRQQGQQVSIAIEAAKTAQIAAGTALEQLRAMQIQADEMTQQRRNTIAKERARLAISFPDGSESMTIMTSSRVSLGSFRLYLDNFGFTPATNVTVGYDAFACDGYEDDEVPPISVDMFHVTAPSIVQNGISGETGPLTIDPRFSTSVVPSYFFVYVRGIITYNDIFHKRLNTTKFLIRRQFMCTREGGGRIEYLLGKLRQSRR